MPDYILLGIGSLITWAIILLYMSVKTFVVWRNRKKIVSELIKKIEQNGTYVDADGIEWNLYEKETK